MSISADSEQSARPRMLASDVEHALEARGGTASPREVARALKAPVWTVRRRLADLVDEGRVGKGGHGVYRLTGQQGTQLGESAAAIVAAIAESGAEAHLTGMDPIASHSHQFLRAFPHLVYGDPDALEQIAFALSQAGFQPVPAGRAARGIIAHAPDLDRMVLLRGQPTARMDRLGVRSEIAPPEKAWLDLLRETRAGNLPLSLNDVGAMLASLLRSGVDEPQLLRWAKEMGYAQHVKAVLFPGAEPPPDDPEILELLAGARQ